MRKLFLPLLCLVLLTWVSSLGARMSVMIIGGGAPAAAGGTDACTACPTVDATDGDVACEDNEEVDGLCDYNGGAAPSDLGDFSEATHTIVGGALACTDKGDKALQAISTTGGENAIQTFSVTEQTELYISFYINFYSCGTANEVFFEAQEGSYAIRLQFAASTGTLRLSVRNEGDATTTHSIGAASLTCGSWHRIEMHWIHASAQGIYLWIDGVSKDLTGADDSTSSNAAREIDLVFFTSASDSSYQIDNFKVDDDTAPADCQGGAF